MAAPTISTTATFNQTRDQICRRALRLIGAIEAGEIADAVTMQDTADALNAMTKEWQASGLHLWTETEGTVIPVPGQNNYSLGTGTTDYCVNGPPGYSPLTVQTVAGQTVLPMVPPAGTAAGDVLLAQNSSGGWSSGTVVSTTSTSVMIASPGLALPCNQNAFVFTWHPSAAMGRPLRVLSLRRYNLQSQISVPLMPLARLDFRGLPNQQDGGLINSWFYDPQLTFGKLWVWLDPKAPIGDICNITYMRPLMDWTNPGNIGDFPQEWLSTIAYNLAVEIAPEYQIPASQMQMLLQIAAAKIDTLKGFDKEPESVFFGYAADPGFFR